MLMHSWPHAAATRSNAQTSYPVHCFEIQKNAFLTFSLSCHALGVTLQCCSPSVVLTMPISLTVCPLPELPTGVVTTGAPVDTGPSAGVAGQTGTYWARVVVLQHEVAQSNWQTQQQSFQGKTLGKLRRWQ